MAKFIEVHSSTENTPYYINVETIRYVLPNPQHVDRSSIRFIGEASPMHIDESATSFISRACAD